MYNIVGGYEYKYYELDFYFQMTNKRKLIYHFHLYNVDHLGATSENIRAIDEILHEEFLYSRSSYSGIEMKSNLRRFIDDD